MLQTFSKIRTNFKRKENRGFTLVEVIIAISVIVILLSVILGSFYSFKKNQSVDKTSRNVFSLIEEARVLTLASREEARYGVHFENDSAVLFKNSYVLGNAGNKVVDVSAPAVISEINLAGGNSVIFDRLIGSTANFGTVVIASVDGTENKIITIYKSGLAQIE
ncbi:MAG: hypothetical protein A3G52_02790 [Candidatus Taylorbacteria bacterium RIFCSPLOWO2_12_FULL_43_20]|uniref:General secretion pathway GspH domain-containing protein n=1 Tax=Candidatus Taylorbacteria bacterium RIFCSPLOWO2_12_FULL_43_20 TaxID=1802332 RepID=A0A1G2NZP2_9BACT|nr:MAG: hypothetical protein A2825_02970 [Candidatus Taylorbacteria bacterium RIFCSPHIGHO2_01_FULL_43_120]OHA23651.1 MAG: hypothetical protein A3B98_03285 [Candidatus Taylorbacteria bacterium RIFCSPHIGHO2_02_FULL_43_55]OHA28126.1 MAG: hypothetical protein A3E92_00275 [Candidatus Taylorbacteria bacterium RIFCSPHIGHO2_12_FULL_42_34]OHA32339.1 MAG: hypothetical protein A3B09_03195 [Candidatus Taylorbacteria bacterium RIFCSPLOWO2_01_FULL_43_83]OHA37676.1 MAG: hypothetical protein A3H58_03315 [Candi